MELNDRNPIAWDACLFEVVFLLTSLGIDMSMPSSHFGLRQLCGIKRTPTCSIIVRKDDLALWASWILSIYLKTKPMCFYTVEEFFGSENNL